MKSNLFLAIILGVITLGFLTFSILNYKELEKYKTLVKGRPPMDGKPEVKSFDEEQLEPRRQTLAKSEAERDAMKEEYFKKNREMVTLRHKKTVYELTHKKSIYYNKKWEDESTLFTNATLGTIESKKKEIEYFQKQIENLNAVFARDNAAYEEKKGIIRNLKQELTDRIPLINDTITREKNYKETQIAQSREELKKVVLKSAATFSFPKEIGSIIETDPVLKVATIDLGKKDGVVRGMRFDIIQEDSLRHTFIKGQIRINNMSDTTATGYIIDITNEMDPIVLSDKIGNPLFIRFKTPIITGEVIETSGGRNIIEINRGKSHNVNVGDVFEVYKENKGTNRIVKSKCKVEEAGENTSKCKLFDITQNNIFAGDSIGTPVDPERVKSFYLAGKFSKKFSKEVIADKIRKFGHDVVDQISPTITFVVTGLESDEEANMARELNVTIMSEDNLLRYLD